MIRIIYRTCLFYFKCYNATKSPDPSNVNEISAFLSTLAHVEMFSIKVIQLGPIFRNFCDD